MKLILKACFWALRPKQWVKNILLFVAPFAAGKLLLSEIATVCFGFCAFSVASSLGYIFNDISDMEIDKLHPKKRQRPFASGLLSARYGIFLASLLSLILICALLFLPDSFSFVVFVYLLNTLLYSKFFKFVPVVEMFSVAFGFILRLISGALILNLEISEWFLIVGGFGALFIVSAKRLAELRQMSDREVREVVRSYSHEFLHLSLSVSISVSVTAYCFWAFNQDANPFWYQLSVFPFVMSLFRYRWMSETTLVEIPEDAILSDTSIVVLSVCLIFFLSVGIYL